MPYSMKPLGCDPQHVKGMSEKLIVSHYENNYGGAVKRLNLITEQLAGLETSRLRFAIFRRSIHKSQNGHRTHRFGSTSSSAGIFCEQSGRAFAHRG